MLSLHLPHSSFRNHLNFDSSHVVLSSRSCRLKKPNSSSIKSSIQSSFFRHPTQLTLSNCNTSHSKKIALSYHTSFKSCYSSDYQTSPKSTRDFHEQNRSSSLGPSASQNPTKPIDNNHKLNKKPILITTPIFYVNASPHIGHLFSVLVADALARYHRLLGHPVRLTTGTDEHGIKVQESADKKGEKVQDFCDHVSKTFCELWKKAHVEYDDYIRTTEDRHQKAVEALWNRLKEKDDIFLGEFEGWYSVSDETFFTSLQVKDELDALGNPTGNKVSIETGNIVTWLKEPNYLFRLSKYQQQIIDWIKTGQVAEREGLDQVEVGEKKQSIQFKDMRSDTDIKNDTDIRSDKDIKNDTDIRSDTNIKNDTDIRSDTDIKNDTESIKSFIDNNNSSYSSSSPIYPPLRYHELVQELTSKPLRDLSVSRLKEKIEWGIPVPGDPKHVIYVWLDALTNYITVCGYPEWESINREDVSTRAESILKGNDRNTLNNSNSIINNNININININNNINSNIINNNNINNSPPIDCFWPECYHIIGKDILKFHSVYWPSFLLSAGLPLPKKIIAHAHWTKDKRKISKSRGNIVDPNIIIEKFGVDPVRYILLRQGGMSNDGDYNEEDVQNLISDELCNSLGNLIARITSNALNPSLTWPQFHPNHISNDMQQIIDQIDQLPKQVDSLYKQAEFGKAIQLIFAHLANTNAFLTQIAPWKMIPKKYKEKKKDTSSAMAPTSSPMPSSSVASSPVAPTSSPMPSSPVAPTSSPMPSSPSSLSNSQIFSDDPSHLYTFENTLYICLESVRVSSLLLCPIIPGLSELILQHLGIPNDPLLRNPLENKFGFDYKNDSLKKSLTGETFVLIDERDKKQAKFDLKMQRRKKETL